MYNDYAQNQFVRLLQWITEYPDIWEEICESNHDISVERCCKIVENLEENSLYILIPILILKNNKTDALNATIKQFVTDCIIKVWDQKGQYALCDSFKEMLQEWEKKHGSKKNGNLIDQIKE